MKNRLIQFLVFSLFILSCRNDEYDLSLGDQTPIDDPVIFVETNLSGLIKDENGGLLSDVEIVVNGEMTKTDLNGFFTFKNLMLSNTGTLVKLEKEGYFQSFKFANGWPGENSYLGVTMIEKKSSQFSSDQSTSVITNGGGRIEFQENSIVDQNDMPYQGSVRVYYHWYDPSSIDLLETMPGDLRGVNDGNESVQLTTFGMMAVELEGDSGQALKLKQGSTATLKFPVPSGTDIEGITNMPTWHLDEFTGNWMQEGEANLVDGNWVTEVSHFSFWNCDMPGDVARLSGELVNEGGTPIANTVIIAKNSFDNTTASAVTNQMGRFQGFVPSGATLTLNILNCGELLEIYSVGLIEEDTDLGIITFDYDLETEFIGQLIDCAGLPISNGYVTIETASDAQLGVADQNGMISIIFNDCNETEATITAYDLDLNLVSEALVADLSEKVVDLETIEVCDDVGVIDCQLTLLCCPTAGFEVSIFDGTAPYDVKVFDGNGILVEEEQFNTDQFDIIVTSGETYDVQIEDVSGAMCISQIELPQYLNRIKGTLWLDKTNGIANVYDAADTPMEGVEVFLIRNLSGQETNVATTVTDMDGAYTFENYLGADYRIQVMPPSGNSFVDQGDLMELNDSHVDADGKSPFQTVGSWEFDKDYIFNAGLRN